MPVLVRRVFHHKLQGSHTRHAYIVLDLVCSPKIQGDQVPGQKAKFDAISNPDLLLAQGLPEGRWRVKSPVEISRNQVGFLPTL